MRTDDGIENPNGSWILIRTTWSWAMTLIMNAIFEIFLIVTRIVFVVHVIAELFVKSANLVGSGNLMLVTKIAPADWITGMLESWFSGS